MKIISLQGLMGGTGNTSIVAALAYALKHLGDNVLAMDLCPTNFLGLQFNMPIEHNNGWATALVNNKAIETSGMNYCKGIDFIPFGNLDNLTRLDALLRHTPNYFKELLHPLRDKKEYQWLLLDLPHQGHGMSRDEKKMIDKQIITLTPNSNCYVRLAKSPPAPNQHCLINQFNPSHALPHDLHLLWTATLKNLLPLTIHQDESVAKAQALKMPVNMAFPNAMASKDITALAHWLMTREHIGITL